MPLPEAMRLFVPAYGATRMIAEVLVEALPLGTPQQNQLMLALGIKDAALLKKTIEEMHEIVAQDIELEQLENVKRELAPIPPRSPGGTMTLADGTVIHSSMAPALPPRSTLPPAPAGDLLGFS